MLELSKLCLDFNAGTPDEVRLFNEFNFKVESGSFVSVVGSNGSGKTTLLNLICGSLMPNSGNLLFDGKDITRLPEYKRAAFIGRVYQDPKIGTCPELTVYENMALADNKGRPYSLTPAISRERCAHYAELVSECHMGLENRMNVKVGALSGGQRQALALVIAGMTDIKLLILDEHTAALDPKTSEIVMELTDRLVKSKNITTLMVTHNLRFALEYGDRLVMMHEGNIVLDKAGSAKQKLVLDDILDIFTQISIECGN